MNRLVTKSLKENDIGFLVQMPRDLMTDYEQELCTFIIDFTIKHKECPSIKRVMKKFDEFIPVDHIPSKLEPKEDPLSLMFETEVNNKLFELTLAKMREAKAEMKDTGEIPVEIFSQIIQANVSATGVTRYSEFDRSIYFRKSRVDIPFKLINHNMGGLSTGDFLLVIGRLGTGKSTIAQFISKDAWDNGKKILFVSAEMNTEDVFARVDGMVGKFNPIRIRHAKESDMSDVLSEVAVKVSKSKGEIIVPRSRIMTPVQIAELAKNLEVDQILVDGVYLLQPSHGKFTSKHERVAAVSNELKQIALELDIPIIGTAQIKRGSSGKAEGETFDPEDISFSDALGQDADFIIAVKPDSIFEGRSELQLIKNRYGNKCATQIYVDFDTMTVIDESVVGEYEKIAEKRKIEVVEPGSW